MIAVTEVAGDKALTERNVRIIRPGRGLAPKHLPAVLGRRAVRALPRGTPIDWEMIR